MSGIYGEGLALMEAEYTEQANGHGSPPPYQPTPITKRTMPVRTKRVDLDGDYAGWWAVVRTNAPFGVFLNMLETLGGDTSGDEGNVKVARAMGELVGALPKLVREWNFVDEEGEDLPCNLDGMKRLPQDLLLALVGKMNEGPTVPKG